MKLSYYTSKVLMGVGISALLSNAILTQEITITDDTMKNYFETSDGQNFNLKQEHTNQDLTINLTMTDLANDIVNDEYKDLSRVNINLNSNNLSFKNTSEGASYVTNYTINAKKTEATDVIFQSLDGKSIVNGDFSIKGSSNPAEGILDDIKSSAILIADGHGLQGSLEVNGNFTADKSTLFTIGGNKSQNHIQVNGKANITNSNFSIGTTSFGDLALNNYVFMSASEGFNEDITSSNKASVNISKNFESIVGMSNKDLGLDYEVVRAMDVKDFVEYELSTKDNKLLISGGANENVNNNKMILESDKKYLELIKTDLKDAKDDEGVNIEKIDKAIAKINEQIKQIQDMISNAGSGIISNDDYIKNDSSVSASNKDFVSKILDGLKIGGDLNAIGSIKFDKVGEQVANDIKDSAKSISNVNQASSGINSTINVSNDVSIGSRVAMLNNPYGNYATKLSQIRFATNDYRGNYIDNYNNSIWGNVIGGANIIDGDSGALYGATIGMDRKINDDVIIGAYFTYANAEIKDNLLTQKSDNFQFGAYSNIHISPKVEVNVKAYAQISPTDQDIVNRGFNTTNSADFNRKFLGLSANMGYIFDFSNNTLFIKPFAGANYYYAYTPSYKENGIAGKDVNSASNNSISLELGAEFRKYMSETSYLFITPKIEQYVMNNGDDYVASLNGVALPSVKSDDKKKTYGQIIIGGNVDISEQFSLNAGVGAKQILAGKTDGKNETYVSGQVGFKYKF
ncbi:autotransporter outer membrane beta-barrel domain-containing protein [Campylobacter sp. IFREMER_LSEM_CL1846]|uniref:autotransporter outer membrane beta-barrel domain-containing protein n=1 Tax=Campylobacter sp. IFREMER_LSEM_CL1846 TaxID=2911614 RepID=UPI0021E6C60E|nr:autotransporter outer membrane beta-barrel domain-containing protein [Campylobacter sp. IFREMER_LSEM_CL1846]HEC1747888.1 autotransporter outer membrane beta-barrel domain-containing protein [Campylobacter lari]MCV3433544.1 autotransporter outer membrane beta-barrel domain-containing protein [Campylobacter sp. IFREMER_LSEM_CL1846]HEC1767812.1 autotransporter outer membrane beta-barrel domain-containing protein [Campylobacter lari]HEC1789642.1 autotransporter outer membrane beta-barrel domain-